MYSIYILKTSGDTLYIGQTDNLVRRLQEHRNDKNRSAKYLRYFSSFKLVHTENFPDRSSAMKREHQLKGWSRAKKEALINCNLQLLEKQ